MSDNIPILLMAFIRPDLLKKSLEHLSKLAPSILYIAIDGPRNKHEEDLVKQCKSLALNPGWNCEVIPIFRDCNIGIVQSFVMGMERMFRDHEFGIFLEDDVLLSANFLEFCKEIFYKYRDNQKIGHINSSNFLNTSKTNFKNSSYFFSQYSHVWGFGTWRRMWKRYDVNMESWEKTNKEKLLKNHCFSYRERRNMKKMFDLHCKNPDPWACDYQWTYNLLINNSLSITPYSNMSLNIGFDRDDSTHTIGKNPFERRLDVCSFPLNHPASIDRNIALDRKIGALLSPSYTNIYKSLIKRKLLKIISLWKRY